MSLFPNPAQDAVSVRCDRAGADARIEFADAIGRRIIGERFSNGSTIDVSTLASGLYLARILDGAGRPIAQERVLIQR